MGSMDHSSAVGRKANAMFSALANDDTEEALCGHHPKISNGDFGPLTKIDAVKSMVSYMRDLRGVSTRVNSYDRGLVTVYLGDIKVLVQVNSQKEN